MISAEQFSEWKTHPVTKEIFEELEQVKQLFSYRLNCGNTIGNTAEETHAMTNRIVGHIEGLNQLLCISYVDEKLSDEVDTQSSY